MPASGWKKCTCCGKWIDPNDDSETHNNAPYGDRVCFRCSWGDNDECKNCKAASRKAEGRK